MVLILLHNQHLQKLEEDGINEHFGASPVIVGSFVINPTALYFFPSGLLNELKDPSADFLLERVTNTVKSNSSKGSVFVEPFFRNNFFLTGRSRKQVFVSRRFSGIG